MKVWRVYPMYMRIFIIASVFIVVATGAVACGGSSNNGSADDLSVPQVEIVQVDGYPLTCVTDVGDRYYGGGVSCDWDAWHALRGD